jgi:hypothetical protein
MRVEWVHPSWRDLVIEHLARDPDARAQFLSSCGAHGLLLALSSAGGERGQRKLPLLVRDRDWDALTDRAYELIPELDTPELIGVLDGIRLAIVEASAARLEALALAHTVLAHVAKLCDATHAPIALPVLEAWLALATRLPNDSERPAPPNLKRTWAELLPSSAPALDDRYGLEQFADWLTLADLLREHDPDELRRFRFGDQAHVINVFMDDVETHKVQPAAEDNVQRALARIETLDPEFGNLSRYMRRRVRAARARLPHETRRPSSEPPPDEAPAWRLFDVARVLNDL